VGQGSGDHSPTTASGDEPWNAVAAWMLAHKTDQLTGTVP